MAEITTDPNDPRLGHGVDESPVPQQPVYLVLSEAERAKGYTRPLRYSYRHVGAAGPTYPLREPTQEERDRHGEIAAWEDYPESELPKVGRFWTREKLDNVGKGCGEVTTMSLSLAETYARDPYFYGSTYCVHCQKHRPVEEFVWVEDETRVGS